MAAKPTYVSREAFQAATDVHTPSNLAPTIDRLLAAASRQIDFEFGRNFYPLTDTVTYKNPHVTHIRGYGTGFFLDRDLRSIASATVDGESKTPADIDLFPAPYGPPYAWVGLTGDEIIISGEWGFTADTEPAGELTAAINSTTTFVDVSGTSQTGIGDMIIVDDERMVVSKKTLVDTTVNLSGTLAADNSDQDVTVTDGTLLEEGEIITIDAERMKVISISGNDLSVIRAWDGSTLATHPNNSDILAPRKLTVVRGTAGSVAASHLDAAPVLRNVPPGLIGTLCLAEAINTFHQEQSGYARTIGSADGAREVGGKGLADLRHQATVYKRSRLAAIP